MSYTWLSIADTSKEAGSQFEGAIVLRCRPEDLSLICFEIDEASSTGKNLLPEHFRRLLSGAELKEAGLASHNLRGDEL